MGVIPGVMELAPGIERRYRPVLRDASLASIRSAS